jgi:hypothetical protein
VRPPRGEYFAAVLRAERGDLVVRRLALRLDELGAALEHGSDAEPVAQLLGLASAATEHAVALNLLTTERAAEVWAAAETRHPALVALDARRYAYS